MSRKIPFKVSARTAQLIGRENVSNYEGAIIELIKNSYDAISSACVIYFDNRYSEVPPEISKQEYDLFTEKVPIIKEVYHFQNNVYRLVKEVNKSVLVELYNFFRSQNTLYIHDNGTGMTEEIIESYWMTIGTNNKEKNYMGSDGRVKTGAKGIGRFALDRLGTECVMYTLPKGADVGNKWTVRWSEFEENEATIDNIFAEIEDLSSETFKEEVSVLSKAYPEVSQQHNLSNGTIFKITGLRDDWDDKYVERLFSNLSTLIPPTEESIFNVYLFTSLSTEKYGIIESIICDDYDYKVYAEVKDEQNVIITLSRNEFDVPSIDKDLFLLNEMKTAPYDIETLKKGSFSQTFHLSNLLKNTENEKLAFQELGPFNFTMYFLKRSISNNEDKEKFFNKNIQSAPRTRILNKFGGIKLYRDFFRIRPYGDPGGSSFDWLDLGERADRSPGGPTQSGGGRIRPNQVLGAINISRLNNINFEDKSSREGLQENNSFKVFKELLISIINMLENDRSKIMRNMLHLHKEKNQEEVRKEQGKQLAGVIVQQKKAQQETATTIETEKNNIKNKEQDEKELLADSLVLIEEENKVLLNELQLMRTLASTGLVITTFAHELQNLSAKIIRRHDDFKKIIDPLIDKKLLQDIEEHNDPYVFIEDIRKQDEKLKYWLDFALKTVKKDKRTLTKLDVMHYLQSFKSSWEAVLTNKSASLVIPQLNDKNKFYFRFFEVDFETIFNNLITNSLAAFSRRDAPDSKEIKITIQSHDNKILIEYSDTGPGLSNEITDPYQIFSPFFTTKRDEMGREIGTGIGMWLVKSAIEYYNGEISISNKRPGFCLSISLPLKKDEGFLNEV